MLAIPIPALAQSDVTQPGDPIVLVNGINDGDPDAGPPPGAETVDRAIDNVGQKYLNFLDLGSGLAVQPQVGATIVTGLRVFTANDEEPRDPASFVLEGSAAGLAGPWTQIAQGPLALPSGRNPGGNSVLGGNFQTLSFANATAYLAYRLTFPTLKNAAAANSMQIAEIELLGSVLGQCFPGPSGLVSWWRAEGNGFDWAGTNSGTLTGGPGFVSGQVGQAFNFTANGQSVIVPASTSLDVGAGPGFTIESWINPTQTNTQMPIVEYNDASGLGLHVWASVTFGGFGGAGSIYAAMRSGPLEGIVATRGVLAPNVWQHVALTYHAGSRLARLYLNGVEKTNRVIAASVGDPLTAPALNIGRRPGGDSFSGRLDEISLYNRPLSAAELLAIYNAGAVGKCFAPARLSAISYPRPWLLASAPGSATFLAEAKVDLNGVFQSNTQVTLNVTYEMRDQDNGLVPLASNTVSIVVAVPAGTGATFAVPLALAPLSPLNSVDRMYFITATLSHRFGTAGPLTADNTIGGPTNRFLYFTGRLFFGPRLMNITGFGLPPLSSTPVPGSHIPVTLLNSTVTSPYVPQLALTGTNLVRLLTNGDATHDSVAFTVSVPGVPAGVVSNVCFTRSSFTFGSGGIAANDFSVKLPTGFGYNVGDAAQPRGRVLQSTLFVGGATLDDFLRPTNPSFTWNPPPGSRYFFCEETKPLWIPADIITWHVRDGWFEVPRAPAEPGTYYHVRRPEYEALQNASVDPDSRQKKSNDRYFNLIDSLGSVAVVRAGPNREALLSANLALVDPDVRTHFPYNSSLVGFGGGSITISNDLIITGHLDVHEAGLTYQRDCVGGDCPAVNGGESFSFAAATGVLNFTLDGGLIGDVSLSPNALEWGSLAGGVFAQAIGSPFNGASYHMPGTFLRGDMATLPPDDRPGFLLFSGFGKPGDSNYVERPGTHDYQTSGLANYAGLNFRVGGSSIPATSTIGGITTQPYPLSSRSKYYVRQGGVSGIHEPVPRSFPTNLVVYGYPFTLSSFGVAYLDNEAQQHLSIIDGSVAVPYPSGFTQDFSRMQITCRGHLDSADLPGNGQSHLLQYWGNRIASLAMSFYGTTGAECAAGDTRNLGLLVETRAPHVPQPMHGVLGFHPNGNLVSPADNKSGLNSRLSLPPNLTLRGPGSESYNFTTVGNAYLNNFHAAPATEPDVGGWLNIAGKIDLAYFEDARVHLHFSARTNNPDPPIHMMGGWRASDDNRGHRGWTTASGLHYFNTLADPSAFDTRNWGYPEDKTLAIYRTNTTDDLYHPRAQQTAFNFVPLDYPLDWSSTTRAFKSFGSKTEKFLVVEVGNQVKRLTPKNAEITFGAEYSGLPKISIGRLLVDGVAEATGVFDSLDGIIDGAVLQNALESLDRALSDRFEGFLGDALGPSAIDPVVDELCAGIYEQVGAGARLAEPGETGSRLTGDDLVAFVYAVLNEQLQQRLTQAVEATGAGSVIGTVNNVVLEADKILGAITNITARDSNGVRTVAANIVRNLVDNEAVQFAALVADYELLFGVMQKLDPTFDEIFERSREIQKKVHAVQADINGGFRQELAGILRNNLNRYLGPVANDLVDWVNENVPTETPPAGQFAKGLQFTGCNGTIPEQFRSFARQRITQGLTTAPLTTGFQVAIKQRLQDVNAEIRETLDTVFQQINEAIRDMLSSQLAGLDNSLTEFTGNVSDVMGAGQIQGYASINDDALNKLRLDARFQMKVPDTMDFRAYLEISALDSQGSAGCKYDGNSATEVKIGALGVPLDWIQPDLNMDLHTKFTTDENGVRGFAGALELRGKIKFELVELDNLAATIAFGQDEAYFGARARARLNSFEVAGGLWFGKACDILPLKIIDPSVAEVVPLPAPITGGYVYAEGWVPVNEWIGIPSTCLLTIRAGVGAGIFFFESGQPAVRTYGAKVLLGADIDLLCIAHAQAIIRLIGAKVGNDFKLRGQGDVSVEIGPCPFCLEFSKTVYLRMDNGDWDVDF